MLHERPSRARLVLLAYLCAMAFILYLDRLCMGQAAESIRKEFQLSKSDIAWIQAAFTIAYGLFEVPTGHWGDRFGSRRVLTRIVTCWSAFTALTAACMGYWSLLVVRFLFGAGEAGAYPNAARVISRWFPPAERGRAQGFFMATSLAGGTFAPVVAAQLIEAYGWRSVFLVFGSLGAVWAVAFAWWFRDNPAEHPAVNRLEAELLAQGAPSPTSEHPPIPWRAVIRHPTVWLLGLAVSCTAFNTYFYFSWFPTYLQEGREVAQVSSGRMTGVVLGCGAIGNLLGGFLGDQLKRRCTSLVRPRRWLASSCLLLAGGLLVVSTYVDDPWSATAVVSGSCFILLMQQATWWSCVVEVSGRFVGALFGLLNGLGGFGAIASQLFFGYFAKYRESQGMTGRALYDPAFFVIVGVLFVGVCCWQWIDSSQSVQVDDVV